MIQRSFAWDEYYNSAFKGKFVALLVCIAIIICIIYKIYNIIMKLYKKSHYHIVIDFEDVFAFAGCMISCACVVLLIFAVIWPTFRYSMYIPFESEEHVIIEHGVITDISPVPYSPKFNTSSDDKPYFASFVTISESQYYFLTADGLSPGMNVEFIYLPRSHMVLHYRTE